MIIVPYRPGDEATLGPVVKSDYFGAIPPERLKIIPEAILLRADAQWRSKIGTSQRRARNVLGSIDFEGGVLTLVQFSMPEDPAKAAYMNNMWELPQAHPYRGDVANSYNDGPTGPGKQGMGNFYEIESLSPAARSIPAIRLRIITARCTSRPICRCWLGWPRRSSASTWRRSARPCCPTGE